MAKRLQVKYLQIRKCGDYRYRRRVPEGLTTVLGKTEFVKVLGRSEIEAIKAYADFHDHVEALIRTAGKSGAAPDPRRIKEAIHSLFSEGEFDPNSTGRTASEKAARDDLADRIFRKYPVDEETGYPDPTDMTPIDNALATALLAGVDAVDLPCTVNTAFDFYLEERKEADPFKRTKQVQRLERARQAVLTATRLDLPLKDAPLSASAA
jgi:hypothetical protein